MLRQKVVPDKYKILSGSVLKLIAIITMLIDHIGAHLMDNSLVLFTLGSYSVTLRILTRLVGRIAFPLFCFLLIEGFLHTRNRLRYGLNLFIFALISEIPWNLEHNGTIFLAGSQNVFFTLLLGYLALCAIEKLTSKPLLQLITILALSVISIYLRADYGRVGFLFIIFLYVLREHEILRLLPSFLLPKMWFVMAAFIPITLYNGKRGFIKGYVMKYAFYIFYPAHIFVIYLLKYHVFA